jgi:hypothetical protein
MHVHRNGSAFLGSAVFRERISNICKDCIPGNSRGYHAAGFGHRSWLKLNLGAWHGVVLAKVEHTLEELVRRDERLLLLYYRCSNESTKKEM